MSPKNRLNPRKHRHPLPRPPRKTRRISRTGPPAPPASHSIAYACRARGDAIISPAIATGLSPLAIHGNGMASDRDRCAPIGRSRMFRLTAVMLLLAAHCAVLHAADLDIEVRGIRLRTGQVRAALFENAEDFANDLTFLAMI